MKAADVMTGRVTTIGRGETVAEAARLMLQQGISGLPVIDRAGNVVGIVTEGDLLRRSETGTERRRPRWLEFFLGPGRVAEDYVRSHSRKVTDVMTARVIGIGPDTPLEDVVQLMERHRIKRLPVLARDRLVGIVSRANLLQGLASLAASAPDTLRSDAAIREQLLGDIDKEGWAPRSSVNPIVQDGVVDLYGAISDERERAALRVAAENIPGVKGVRDHLVWIEPMSGVVIEASHESERSQSTA